MPTVKIRQIGQTIACGGFGLPPPKGVSKRLVRGLDPGEVVDVPDDIWKQLGKDKSTYLEITDEEPTRPYVFEDEATAQYSRPRYQRKNLKKHEFANRIAARDMAQKTARLSEESVTRVAMDTSGSRKK